MKVIVRLSGSFYLYICTSAMRTKDVINAITIQTHRRKYKLYRSKYETYTDSDEAARAKELVASAGSLGERAYLPSMDA